MILALDLSTKTGWAVFNKNGSPVSFGLITKTLEWDCAPYPRNFIEIADKLALDIIAKVKEYPEVTDVVVEEINKPGRMGSRFSQKILDFLHMSVCRELLKLPVNIRYINTSDWRKKLKLSVAEAKKQAKPFVQEYERKKKQANLQTDPKIKKQALEELKALKETLKQRCIHGKIDKKSMCVGFCNMKFGLTLKKGDDNQADALAQGLAFMLGCPVVDNTIIFNKEKE